MDIATWNVNSVNARLPNVIDWLREANPDIVCLQEIKCEEAKFPRNALEDLGYNILIAGQKTYNGVAILSKFAFEETAIGLPGNAADEQARWAQAVIATPLGPWRVVSLYLPNGNPVGSEKYPYKLGWMERLHAHASALLALEEPLVLAGDYNVIPRPEDCHDPASWSGDALFLPQTRAAFRTLKNLGLVEAFEQCDDRSGQYTFWDYQAGAWAKDHGIRIDHHLLSAQAADYLTSVRIHRAARGRDKASDHVPVVASFGRS